jgi:hypothetical protein
MTAYIIHFDLDSFIGQADTTGVGDEPIYVTHLLTSHSIHGVRSSVDSVIIATYQDIGKNIHAARFLIEQASVLADRGEVVAAIRERANTALQALEARLPGEIQRNAIQFCPGLYEDLARFEAAHDCWHWEGAIKDPLARRLIAGKADLAPRRFE